MQATCWDDEADYDYAVLLEGLNRYLRLKTMPIGMKRYRTVAEMEATLRLRRPDPSEKLATAQVVGQSRWLGWTIEITMNNLIGAQCGALVGLRPRSKEWLIGDRMNGVWYGTLEDSAAHQQAISCASHGE